MNRVYFVGIDIGTSSTKAVVFDSIGRALGAGSHSYDVIRGPAGEVEQDPETWWSATCRAVSEALSGSRIPPADIAALSLSGQMHGMVALDHRGGVVRPAILHSDVRAGEEVRHLGALRGSLFKRISRNPVFPGFQAVSLNWLKNHEPESLARSHAVICPKDYVRFRLTGRIGVEHTDASGTLLYDMEQQQWSDELIDTLGLPAHILPAEIAQPQEVAGHVTSSAAASTGLLAGTPVVFGGADQAMHSLGNGVFTENSVMATTGSSGQVLTVSTSLPANRDRPISTFRHILPDTWYGLGGVLSAGTAIDWYRRMVMPRLSFEELEGWVKEVPAGSGGLMFLPTLAGERTPYMDPAAKGAFIGVSILHDRRHFARAVLEGVGFAMRACLEEVTSVYGGRERLILAGGSTRNPVYAQIQTDTFGREAHVSRVKEQGCLGAAITAAVGVRAFPDIHSACDSMCDQEMTVLAPREVSSKLYDALYNQVYVRLYENNSAAFAELSKIQESK